MKLNLDEHQPAVRDAVLAFRADCLDLARVAGRERKPASEGVWRGVFAGMGFTWDMLPHYFLKRAWVLEHLFGAVSWHATRVGDGVGDEAGGEVAVS
jgi:hypothetical protein